MMVEPVGTTLAVVGILQPTFHLCRTLYRSYKGVRLFGQDHVRLNREYDFQMARLNHVSEQKLEFMELKINPNNKDDVNAQSVKQKLDAIYEQMKRSKNILDSFDDAAKKDDWSYFNERSDQPSLSNIQRIIRESSISQTDRPEGQDREQKRLSSRYATLLPERFIELAQNVHGKGHHAKMAIHWLQASKEVEEAIKYIRDGILDLETFVKYRPSMVLAIPPLKSEANGSLVAVREAVRKLHLSLLTVNHRTKRPPFEIAVKPVEDPESVGRALESAGVAVRNDHFAFPIMIHHERDEEAAMSVVAEIDPRWAGTDSTATSTTHEAGTFGSINELGQSLPRSFTPTGVNSYNTVGCIRRPLHPEHVHLFHNTRATYFRKQPLAEILGTQDFQDHVDSGERLQLAILLSHAYLYFARIVSSKADIRPSSIHFYDDGSTQSGWDTSSGGFGRYFSTLFISIGFGEAKLDYDAAMQSANRRSTPTNSVEELGVLLYQVAGCGKIDYEEETNGLSLAKEIAERKMHDVDRFMCGSVSEIISDCLNWQPTADMDDEKRMVEVVLCRLKSVEDELKQ